MKAICPRFTSMVSNLFVPGYWAANIRSWRSYSSHALGKNWRLAVRINCWYAISSAVHYREPCDAPALRHPTQRYLAGYHYLVIRAVQPAGMLGRKCARISGNKLENLQTPLARYVLVQPWAQLVQVADRMGYSLLQELGLP